MVGKGVRAKERGWIGCYRVEDFSISDSKATWTANSFTRFSMECTHGYSQGIDSISLIGRV